MQNLQDFKNALVTDLTKEGLTPYYAVAITDVLTQYFTENGFVDNQLRTLRCRVRTIDKAMESFETRFKHKD